MNKEQKKERNVSFNLIFGTARTQSHSHKLCARVSLIWGNRQRQPTLCAMSWSQLDRKEFLIAYTIAPGKYAFWQIQDLYLKKT